MATRHLLLLCLLLVWSQQATLTIMRTHTSTTQFLTTGIPITIPSNTIPTSFLTNSTSTLTR